MGSFRTAFTVLVSSWLMMFLRDRIHIADAELLASTKVLVDISVAGVMSGIVAVAAFFVPLGQAFWDKNVKARMTTILIQEAKKENPNVDLAKAIDNVDVARAQLDEDSPVDVAVIITDKLVARAALDPTSAVTAPLGQTKAAAKALLRDRKDEPEVVIPIPPVIPMPEEGE